LIANNKIAILNELGKIMNEYYLNSESYTYSWLNNDNSILIEQAKGDTVAQVYIIDPVYEGKSLVTQTYSIEKELNFSKELKLSEDQSKLLMLDNNSSLWILQPPIANETEKGF